jgi:hypothetical protein
VNNIELIDKPKTYSFEGVGLYGMIHRRTKRKGANNPARDIRQEKIFE